MSAQPEIAIRAALFVEGAPLEWVPALHTIAVREREFRGPGEGLFGMIRPVFEVHCAPGWDDILDPIANARAAIRYIRNRYGADGSAASRAAARGGAW